MPILVADGHEHVGNLRIACGRGRVPSSPTCGPSPIPPTRGEGALERGGAYEGAFASRCRGHLALGCTMRSTSGMIARSVGGETISVGAHPLSESAGAARRTLMLSLDAHALRAHAMLDFAPQVLLSARRPRDTFCDDASSAKARCLGGGLGLEWCIWPCNKSST